MHAGPVYHSCFFEGPLYHSSTIHSSVNTNSIDCRCANYAFADRLNMMSMKINF